MIFYFPWLILRDRDKVRLGDNDVCKAHNRQTGIKLQSVKPKV